MEKHVSLEAFHPGEYIHEEIDARGWTQVDLAAILNVAPSAVNELIKGKRSVSPEVAKNLAAAFGTSAQFWMNLQSAYRLAQTEAANESIKKRAELYNRFPIREMIKRHWIAGSKNIAELEAQVCQFFRIPKIDAPIHQPHAARHSAGYGSENLSHEAWFRRVKDLAPQVSVTGRYSEREFDSLIGDLRELCVDPNDLLSVSNVLSEYGIRLVIVEHFPKTKLDGVNLWLDKNSPVIGMSLRYDRVDNFWFTLFHELCHLKNRDGSCEAVDIYAGHSRCEDKPPSEQRADVEAADLLLPQEEFEDFVKRKGNIYSADDIIGFAMRTGVHAGIVAGRLRYHEQRWTHYGKFLVKVRSTIIGNTLTDGWGVSLSI